MCFENKLISQSNIHTLSLGCANIPEETIDSAVDALIKTMAPIYMELVRETMEIIKLGADFNINGPSKEFPSGTLSLYPIQQQELKDDQIENGRCYIRFEIKIQDLQDENPLDHLLIQLMQRIFDLGYKDPAGLFDVRLEKGYLSTIANFWHFDETFKTSITVCYSNRENWSTRLLDIPKIMPNPADFKKIMQGPNRYMVERAPEFIQKVESLSEPAQFGFLYDALNVYHRAPIASDLGQQELDINDYRLFIRYKV